MGKDKFKKRKERRRLIRGEMTKRGISGKEIAARVNRTESAVSQGCATSPRIVAELIRQGVPARLFGKSRGQDSPSPLSSPTRGEGDKDHRRDACATEGE
jgi:hypothetical protein